MIVLFVLRFNVWVVCSLFLPKFLVSVLMSGCRCESVNIDGVSLVSVIPRTRLTAVIGTLDPPDD